VFTREDGRLVRDFREAWWNACIRAGLGRFQCRGCRQTVIDGRKCRMCNSKKKAKYFGLHFHDLRRTGTLKNMSRKGIPENVGMLISSRKSTAKATAKARMDRGPLFFFGASSKGLSLPRNSLQNSAFLGCGFFGREWAQNLAHR